MRRLLATAALLLCSAPAVAFADATFTIINLDGFGEGFNDPTPVAPVGGNAGTTRGQQRLIAFQAAANIWGPLLDSDVPIRVGAQFNSLTCTATSAVLGSAGARYVGRNFANAPLPDVWFHAALANSYAGSTLGLHPQDIDATFNSNLGNPGCLTGITWYLGLDGNAGPLQIDLVTVLLHEFGHGLGFSSFVDKLTGANPILGLPDIYELHLLDTTTGQHFHQMTDAQRLAAIQKPRRVSWDGSLVTDAIPDLLAPGTPLMTISAPAELAGEKMVGVATFGNPLTSTPVIGDIQLVSDGVAPSTDACEPLTTPVTGKLALVDRGNCDFHVKALNVQNAGAIAMVMIDNLAGSHPADMGGVNPSVSIPSVSIAPADGTAIQTALMSQTVTANLFVDMARFLGADSAGRGLLYTPIPIATGSSISHWDTGAFPNLLMEPFINSDLGHGVDLALPLFGDLGWPECHDGADCSDGDACNGTEVCVGFACTAGTPPVCDDGNACTMDSCDAFSGCLNPPVANGTSCADADLCDGAETCQGGACSDGTPPNCDDGNVCTAELCIAATGCASTPVSAGTPCGGGGTCDGAGACAGAVCQGVKLTSPTPSPFPSNSAAAFNATNVSCGSGQTPEYRFMYRRNGGPSAYAEFRGWGTSPNATFNNTGFPSGEYTFQVRARHVGSTQAYESQSALTRNSGNVCKTVALSSLQPPPKAPGTIVDLTGAANCTEGEAEYKFFYRPAGTTTFTVLRNWGEDDVEWNTTGLAVGDYVLRVYARGAGNSTSFESSRTLNFKLADKCTIATIGATPKSPEPSGALVTIAVEATCEALSTPDLRFTYRLSGTPIWIELQPWGPGTSAPWNTLGLAPGIYQLRAETRAPGLTGAAQHIRTINFKLE